MNMAHRRSNPVGAPAPTIGCAYLDVPAFAARVWLAWSERGLQRLTWSAEGSGAQAVLGQTSADLRPLPAAYADVLRAYFAGEAVDPTVLAVDLYGTPFQTKVWHALRAIGRGQVQSYAAIAAAVGAPRATRAVGGANGSNRVAIVVPCHRVVAAGHRLGGYTGGLRFKRLLLELEGARIVSDVVHPGQMQLLPD